MADPLLNSDPTKAQEYLQGLLATEDPAFTPVLRRRPIPLTDGPPDDEHIVRLNIATLRSHLYIDHIYRKIAELATLLSGSDIPKSPAGWVRLQTLQSYDGVDVPGNLHPTTQTAVATNKFSVTSKGNLRPMSKEILESLLFRDHKAQRSGRRFQYAAYGPPPPPGGRTIKEYAVRLSPDAQLSPEPEGLTAPPAGSPPFFGGYFCTHSMLTPLRKYGISPKNRGHDGYAVKLQPLASCDSATIHDALTHSTLRGAHADTLLLVDIHSTRGSHLDFGSQWSLVHSYRAHSLSSLSFRMAKLNRALLD